MTKGFVGGRITGFPGRRPLNLVFILLGGVLALALLEIGLRLFWHRELSSWQRNLTVTIPLDPEVIPGVAGPARIITNSGGIRGPEWAGERSREYRILAIGGSTTACLMQDQPRTWAALLQARMPATADGRVVWVGNAGHDGHSSRHDVLAMRFMPDKVQPDAVVILMGGNDPRTIRSEGPAYDPRFIDNGEKMRTLSWDFAERPVALLDSGRLSVRNLYLVLFLKEFRSRFFDVNSGGMVHRVETIRKEQQKWRQAERFVDDMPDLRAGLEGYRHNLLEIIRLARARRVHLVFMTQPSSLRPEMRPEETRYFWGGRMEGRDDNAYWSLRVQGAMLDAHNGVLLEMCRREGVDCLDLASLLPKTGAVFWDYAHFSDYGSSLAADELVKYFKGHFEKSRNPGEAGPP